MIKRDIPGPILAAAGAGDLAYRQLRKLPEATTRTLRTATQSAQELRERVAATSSTDLAKVRESAARNATAVIAGAVTAQQRAVTGYRNLVAHGGQVMGERVAAGTVQAESPTEIPATSAPVVPEETVAGTEAVTAPAPTTGTTTEVKPNKPAAAKRGPKPAGKRPTTK